jgi:hypothetical protein
MVYIIGLIFKAQINLMWILEEFKVSEILCVAIFNTICTSSFDTNCLHRTMETPSKNIVENLVQPSLDEIAKLR